MKTPRHPWHFRPRFRTRALGWRGSSLAIQRLKEALAEIKAVHRTDPVLAAEGAILVLERIWPAFQAVDTSSGSLGNAVGKTVHELLDLLLTVPADDPTWDRWRDRLWTAVEEDGVDYLSEVVEHWPRRVASTWRSPTPRPRSGSTTAPPPWPGPARRSCWPPAGRTRRTAAMPSSPTGPGPILRPIGRSRRSTRTRPRAPYWTT